MNSTEYTLENRSECSYCGGSARCGDCNGDGEDGNVGNEGACESCAGSGVCAECMDGVEQWLVRGERASCLNHREAWIFMCAGIVPDWFEKFHDQKAVLS